MPEHTYTHIHFIGTHVDIEDELSRVFCSNIKAIGNSYSVRCDEAC
jgi:hypothetical protein